MIKANEPTPDRLSPERLHIAFGVMESEMDLLKKHPYPEKWFKEIYDNGCDKVEVFRGYY